MLPIVFRTASMTLAFSLTLSAQVQADVSAADVWADWTSYMRSMGYAVSGVEQPEDDRLVVKGVTMRADISDDDGSIVFDMGEIVFAETGDGAVDVTLAPRSSVALNVTGEEGEDVDIRLTYDQTAPALRVSGTPDAMVYAYTAEQVALALSELTVDGITLGRDIATAELAIKDVAATTTMRMTGDMRGYDQAMTAGAMAYVLRFRDPEAKDGDSFDLQGQAASLSFAGTSTIPVVSMIEDVNAFLVAGGAGGGAFAFGPGGYSLTADGSDGGLTVNTTSQGGRVEVALASDGLRYDAQQDGFTLNAVATEFPLPISVSSDSASFSLRIPVRRDDAAQDFALGLALSDLTVSDAIWGLFDPEGKLPRDPATLALDLTGKVRVLFDFLDPAQAAVLDSTGAAPGELEAVTLNTLRLDVAGAALTGSGDFTFDNSDTTTFNGMPKPTGTLDLRLVGGNGLIDKLSGLGLLPQEQAMGARMMLGLFTVPGDGDDVLTSKIEVTKEGQVLANGQRIQ